MEGWARELLKTAAIIHLATLKEDGSPALRPVNFLYEKDRIYIHTGPESGKIIQIQRDPRVCLEVEQILQYIPAVDRPCTATYSCRSVVIEGIARLVSDEKRKRDILQRMMEKFQPEGGYRPVSVGDAKMTAVIEVRVGEISSKDHMREGDM